MSEEEKGDRPRKCRCSGSEKDRKGIADNGTEQTAIICGGGDAGYGRITAASLLIVARKENFGARLEGCWISKSVRTPYVGV